MPANEMFEKIRSDFVAQQPVDEPAGKLLHAFCEYATKWLNDAGLVGVGHTTSGMSLRFADGNEYLLTEASYSDGPLATMPAVSITGNNAGIVRSGGSVQDSSVRIMGNA